MTQRYVKQFPIRPDHPIVGIHTGMTGYWRDLIELAAGVDGYQGLNRGQLRASRSLLADRWRKLSDKQIRGFLDRLVHAEMLQIEPDRGARNGAQKGLRRGQQKGRGLSLYTIVNYRKYQGDMVETASDRASDRARNGAQKGQSIKRKKEEKEIERLEPSVLVDDQIDLEELIAAKTPAKAKEDLEAKVLTYWNDLAKNGFQKAPHLTPKRRSAIKARIKDAGSVEGVIDLIDHLAKQDWATGKKKNPKTGQPYNAQFDTFFKPDAFIRHYESAQAEKAKHAEQQARRNVVIREEDAGW